jgi:hypothetical protein
MQGAEALNMKAAVTGTRPCGLLLSAKRHLEFQEIWG